MQDHDFMGEALALAREAAAEGEVPVGCVIVRDGKIVGRGRTRRETDKKALAHAAAFDYGAWAAQLRSFLGKGAESMIALEAKEGKYDPAAHAARLEILLQNWDVLLDIICEELPSSAEIEGLLQKIGAPTTLGQIGVEAGLEPMIFRATKDIRDKYVLSRLLWDLGILDEMLE